MRFTKDNALMLEAAKLKPTKPVQLPNGLWYRVNSRGTKRYSKDSAGEIPHRLDGPAIETANGSKYWRIDGEYHRVDGPAVEYACGSKFYFVNGVRYTRRDFNKLFGKYTDVTDRQVVADMDGMFN